MAMTTVEITNLDWVAFGKYMAERRRRIGMTQVQLAEAINRAQSDVSKFEAGAVQPTIETFVRIADSLQVKPETLLTQLQRK